MSLDVSTLAGIALDAGHIIQLWKYCNVGLAALLIYDHLLTFDLEVSRIWTLPWRLPKILFLTNRYVAPPCIFFDVISQIVPNLSPVLCKGKKWIAFSSIVAVLTVQLLLVLRVLALYGNDKKVARFLIAMFLAALLSWGIFATVILLCTKGYSGGAFITGCIYSIPDYMYLVWIVPMALENILIGMTIYKTGALGTTNRTIQVLARDSIIYFVTIFCLLVVEMVYSRFGKPFSRGCLMTSSSVFACIGASRLATNLRAECSLDRTVRTMSEEAQSMFFGRRRFRGNRLTAVRPGEEVAV